MKIENFVTYYLGTKRQVIGCINEKDAKEWKKTMEKDKNVFNVEMVS